MNLNPRSLYNKIQQFQSFVREREIDLITISESWEREDEPLSSLIDLEGYTVISNPFARKGVGGRPAIIVNTKKFCVENLTQTEISIPYGVEACWCILKPIDATNSSIIKHFAVVSFYSKPNSRKKQLLYDHLYEGFHSLSAKYDNLFWLFCADINDLKIEPILQLKNNFKQCVLQPTRQDKTLDVIISDLGPWYQCPTVEPPLDVDQDKAGSPSDHSMVVWSPLDSFENKKTKETKTVQFRPLKEIGFQIMEHELNKIDWSAMNNLESADDKAKYFHETLYGLYVQSFPMKSRTFSNDCEPWYTEELGILKKKKRREFEKHRKSEKYSPSLIF